jgi:hypothetical protein
MAFSSVTFPIPGGTFHSPAYIYGRTNELSNVVSLFFEKINERLTIGPLKFLTDPDITWAVVSSGGNIVSRISPSVCQKSWIFAHAWKAINKEAPVAKLTHIAFAVLLYYNPTLGLFIKSANILCSNLRTIAETPDEDKPPHNYPFEAFRILDSVVYLTTFIKPTLPIIITSLAFNTFIYASYSRSMLSKAKKLQDKPNLPIPLETRVMYFILAIGGLATIGLNLHSISTQYRRM